MRVCGVLGAAVAGCVGVGGAAFGESWKSAVTGGMLQVEVRKPERMEKAGGVVPTVVYLEHLAAVRVGTEGDEAIVGDFLQEGMQVVVVDYGKNEKSLGVAMNADIRKMREDLVGKKFLAEGGVDLNKLYIVPEGCRVKRDVVFYEEGGVTWAMDILYPSKAAQPVPALMEITCDNANRMGAGSLVFCHDTLIEGGLLEGFAGAMVDHPVAKKYAGMFPMPESTERMKAAVRTLRAEGKGLGFNGKIGVIGFSRGSPQAALLAVTNGRKEFEKGGMHEGESSDVQAALIHGERYDFMTLDPEEDGMFQRFTKAWGKREEKPEAWDAHSAIRHVTKDAAPMFLNTSDKEEVTYREQLAEFEKKLTEAGVEHVYQVDADGRGHRVTTDAGTLGRIYGFFGKWLK